MALPEDTSLREVAERLLELLRQVETTRAYDDEELLREIKSLNLRLAPIYSRLYGATPLITTSYPPRIWLTRAKESASDALALIEANPSLQGREQHPAEFYSVSYKDADEQPTAFLLMPFDDHFDWLREEVVAAGNDVGVAVKRADDIFAAGSFMEQIKQSIRDADAIIAVCTGRNPNVFYELGLSEPLHYPILLAEDAKDLPSDVAHLRAQLYGSPNPPNNRETLRPRIGQALQETLAARRTVAPAQSPVGSEARAPLLNARIHKSGRNYILEIENEGQVSVTNLSWEINGSAPNWRILTDVLPVFPVPILDPGDYVRVPVSISIGGPGAVELVIHATSEEGEAYERRRTLSVWG
jgi:hypothetical protein